MRLAVVWDFDMTISVHNQQHWFLSKFWNGIRTQLMRNELPAREPNDWLNLVDDSDSERGIAYVNRMISDARPGGCLESLTRQLLIETGKHITIAPGFADFVTDTSSQADHYIVTMGLEPIMQGFVEHHSIPIKGFYATRLGYTNEVPDCIKRVCYGFTKMEYIIGIAKGCQSKLNKLIPDDEYEHPYKKMILIGDGQTDIPMFASMAKKGAKPVVVYEPGSVVSFEKAMKELALRADYVVPRDYSRGSITYNLLCEAIDKRSQDVTSLNADSLYRFARGELNSQEQVFYHAQIAQDERAHAFFDTAIVYPDGCVVQGNIIKSK